MPWGHRGGAGRTGYTIRRVSNYDGFKALDDLQQKIAEGKLTPAREHPTDYLCEVCKTRKRSVRVVPCLTMGRQLAGTPIKGRVILACDDGPGSCARSLERAGVPQAAAEMTRRMQALGLVLAS